MGALGVVGSLCALKPVEPRGGAGGVVAARLRQAASGEVAAEAGERVAVSGPAASGSGGLRQGAQQRDRAPHVVPGGLQLLLEGSGDPGGGAAGACAGPGARRAVVGADEGFEDGLVEAGIGGRAGGRAAERVLGGQRGLQAGHARRRVDPGELRGQAGVFQRALPAGPVLGQHAGEVGEERTAGMVGAVGEEGQPLAQGGDGRVCGVGPVGLLEPGCPAQQAEVVAGCPVGDEDLGGVCVPVPFLAVPGCGDDLGGLLAGGDVAEHGAGQAGEELQPQLSVARLGNGEQVGAGAAGPGHRGDGGGGIAGQGQRDDDQGLRGELAVPDLAERPGLAGCGCLDAGEAGEHAHAAPPVSSSARLLA